MRDDLTRDIWEMTKSMDVLHPDNWRQSAMLYVKEFELKLIKAMRSVNEVRRRSLAHA